MAALNSSRQISGSPYLCQLTPSAPLTGLAQPNIQAHERDERVGTDKLPAMIKYDQRQCRERTHPRECAAACYFRGHPRRFASAIKAPSILCSTWSRFFRIRGSELLKFLNRVKRVRFGGFQLL